jgi:hypothetical protein
MFPVTESGKVRADGSYVGAPCRHAETGHRESIRISSVAALTHCIARLNTSSKRGTAKWWVRELLLRARALMLTYGPQNLSDRWSNIRRLVIVLDPVAAGLWPHLRRRTALNLPQRFARWLSSLENPSAREAIPLEDVLKIRRVLHEAHHGRIAKTPSNPRGSSNQDLAVETAKTVNFVPN